MEVTLQIQRYQPDDEQSRLESFTVDAPETATLLDVLDQIKDEQDGSLSIVPTDGNRVRMRARRRLYKHHG